MLGPDGHRAGQGRADQHVLAAGVGALVQTHDRGTGLKGQAHVDGRCHRPDHGRGQHGPEAPRGPELPTQMEQDQDHRRPDDVELLLDGQRPHVLERRGLGRGGEVAAATDDEVPVGHIEQRGERVEADSAELPRATEHLHEESHADQHHQQGGQEPAGPAGPELTQLDGQPFGPLPQQQGGDEETRQDEEDVDAQKSPGSHRCTTVVEEDARHRHRPEAVQCRDIGEHDGSAPALPRLHERACGSSWMMCGPQNSSGCLPPRTPVACVPLPGPEDPHPVIRPPSCSHCFLRPDRVHQPVRRPVPTVGPARLTRPGRTRPAG